MAGSRRLVPTAHQTTGPFFPAQYIRAGENDLRGPHASGEVCYIHGRVGDAAGAPAVNVIIEIWQADSDGRFAQPGFFGWGRTWTDQDGAYSFITVKPGAYRVRLGANRWFAPRINIRLIGSGVMRPLMTCLFFPDEPLNADDPQFTAITAAAARRRLLASREPHPAAPAGSTALRFDIVLGGREGSTFFED